MGNNRKTDMPLTSKQRDKIYDACKGDRERERRDFKRDRVGTNGNPSAKPARIIYMARAKDYVMVRHPGCIPFAIREREWLSFPLWQRPLREHPRAKLKTEVRDELARQAFALSTGGEDRDEIAIQLRVSVPTVRNLINHGRRLCLGSAQQAKE